MCPESSVPTISDIESEPPGWPEPASVVAFMTSLRARLTARLVRLYPAAIAGARGAGARLKAYCGCP